MLNRIVLGLVVAFGFVVGAQAQDENTAAKSDKRKARMAKSTLAKFAKAELTEEQLANARSIFMNHVDELIEAQKAVDAVNKKIRNEIVATLSEEQQKALAQIRKRTRNKKSIKSESISVAISLPNMT